MLKTVAVLSTACLICLLVAIAFYLQHLRSGLPRQTLDSPAIVKEVRQLNELVTVKYGIEKVVGMKEEKSPVGTESILLLVQGNVLAGIDLAELKSGDVTISDAQSVRVRLTPPRIQTVYLDEKYTKVWDRSITWWTPWVTPDVDLEHKARMRALDDIKSTALEMGILKEARRNAEADIRNLLQAFGMGKVDFIFST